MNAHEMGRAGVGFVAAELERVTAQRDEAVRIMNQVSDAYHRFYATGNCGNSGELSGLDSAINALNYFVRERMK